MKKIFFSLFILIGVSLSAQYQDLKGLTFHATLVDYSKCNQIFDISFSDGFLVHNVLTTDCDIDAVQFYKITDLKRSLEAGNTYFKFTAISGVSGSSYKYVVKINSAGEATVTLKSDSGDIVYTGLTYNIKTYDQNP